MRKVWTHPEGSATNPAPKLSPERLCLLTYNWQVKAVEKFNEPQLLVVN